MVNKLVIESDPKAARDVQNRVLREVERHGYSNASAFAIRLALEEGLNNAIKHGNRMAREKKVEVAFEIDADQVAITITDEGPGFNPGVIPDPTADENLEKPSGRGIMLMRAYMDEVQYDYQGRQVRLVKRRLGKGHIT